MAQQNEITRITIDGNPVGIQGLKFVIEAMSLEYKDRNDTEITEELLNRLSKINYIPETVKEKYGKAVLKEFYRHTGNPDEEDEDIEGIKIKVLGPGCPQCDQLEMELMTIMSEENIRADIEHIRDLREIGEYGVMGTPALVINDKIKSVGSIPPRYKIIEWLNEI